MRRVSQTGQFKRDLKREAKGKYGVALARGFTDIVRTIANDEQLAEKYRDHALTGDWKDYRDCHIKPDLVLIYRKLGDDELQLVRLGSHSELGF